MERIKTSNFWLVVMLALLIIVALAFSFEWNEIIFYTAAGLCFKCWLICLWRYSKETTIRV